MNEYSGHEWIKVKREESVLAGSLPADEPVVSEKHHIDECDFLIDEVRKLASRLERQSAALQRYKKQVDDQVNRQRRQAFYESDYLPYEEDEYDR